MGRMKITVRFPAGSEFFHFPQGPISDLPDEYWELFYLEVKLRERESGHIISGAEVKNGVKSYQLHTSS
jgi:hypothetical protein